MTLPFAQLIARRVLGHSQVRRCASCGDAIGELPALRIHGTVVHRDCLGYRARQQLRSGRA